MDQDPLINFLSSLSNKIKEEKDHKELMEKINSGETQNLEENPLEKALLKIKEKILEHKPPQPSNDLQVIKELVVEDSKTQVAESEITDIQEEDNFGDFISKLRGVLTGKPLPVKEEAEQEAEEIKNVPVASEPPDEPQATAPLAAPISNKSDTTNNSEKYLDALDSITNDVAKETEPAKMSEIKKLIEEYAGKYIKKAIVMSEYAGGGGTNAVQYAEGGTMNGDLNVNGHILSGGVDISNFFGGSGGTQTLTFNNSNADLSISNGNTVSLSALSGEPTDRLTNSFYQVVLSSNGVTSIPGVLAVPGLTGGGIVSASQYDSLVGFYGQSNIPVIQNGSNGTIDIGLQGIVTVSSPGENYTNGIAIIGGGSRILITVNPAGWVFNSNRSITFPDNTTQTTAFTGNPDLTPYALASNFVHLSGDTMTGALSIPDLSADNIVTTDNIYISGNAGIGTSNPETKLHVAGVITAQEGNSNQWNSVYTLVSEGSASNLIDGGNIRGANIAVGTRDGYHVALRSNNANRVWILSSGEVGVGLSLSSLINLVSSSSPNSPRLTVSGILSTNNIIYAAGGDSNSWNSVYTTTSTNSASWTAGSSQIRTPGVASIGVGKDALVNPAASSGQHNTALGNNALSTCGTGAGNTAVGSGSLPNLTAGSLNTALGYNTLLNCVTGTGNIAIGANALTNSNGYNNVAIGVDTLLSAPAAGILFGDNTAVGNGALSSVSGGSNIALGFRAGETLPAGNSNIFIGVVATTNLPTTGSIAIGRNASPTQSNQLVLGSPSYPLTGNSILYGNLAVTSTNNALSTTGGTSDNWNSTYTTVSANSAYWADTRNNVTFSGTVSAGSNILSNQVAFSVNNQSVAAGFGAGTTITYNVTNVNRGNALNTSTGIFTAPVAGVYFITFSGITESTGPHEVVLYKNDSFFPGIRSYNQDAGYNSINFSLAMPLNATDTLKIVVLTGKIHGNNGSCFSGYLIG